MYTYGTDSPMPQETCRGIKKYTEMPAEAYVYRDIIYYLCWRVERAIKKFSYKILKHCAYMYLPFTSANNPIILQYLKNKFISNFFEFLVPIAIHERNSLKGLEIMASPTDINGHATQDTHLPLA
jgi:hypothetical protein